MSFSSISSTLALGSNKVSGGWESCGGVCDATVSQRCLSNLLWVLFQVDYEMNSLMWVPLFWCLVNASFQCIVHSNSLLSSSLVIDSGKDIIHVLVEKSEFLGASSSSCVLQNHKGNIFHMLSAFWTWLQGCSNLENLKNVEVTIHVYDV